MDNKYNVDRSQINEEIKEKKPKPKIRWSEADDKEFKRVVKNYNAKINRLAKKDPKNAKSLPAKITSKDITQLKELIGNRQEFNRELNSLKRFSNKGSEDIFVILRDGSMIKKDIFDNNPEKYETQYSTLLTRWEKNEISRRLPKVNEARAIEKAKIEALEITINGEKVGYKKGDIGMDKNILNALKPLEGITGGKQERDIRSLMRNLRRQSISGYFATKTDILRENYIEALKTYYGEQANDLVSAIEELDDDSFLNVFYSENNASMEIASPKKANKNIEAENLTMLKNAWLGEPID